MSRSPGAIFDEAFGEPEERLTVAESVAGRIRELILTGKLPPGTPLRLAQLASRLGVSVMPVREAIRILEAERLVTVEPRRGAHVAQLTLDDVEELYAVRSALEALAARHGARAIKPADVRRMRTALEAMERAAAAGDVTAFLAHDRRFHDVLYVASGRPGLVARIHELLANGRRIVDPHVYQPSFPLSAAAEAHRPILDAVGRRDTRLVEELIRDNIAQAGERVLLWYAREVAQPGQT